MRINAMHFENVWEFSGIWQDMSNRAYAKSTSLFILQHLLITMV